MKGQDNISWHGWIYARKEQEQFLRSFGVTGDMNWIPNEHREDWVDADGVNHMVGPYLKVAEGYFEQCIVKSHEDMTRLMYYHLAFIAASFTGIDEDGNHLPNEEQIYWKCSLPSIEEFASVFGILMNVGPITQTPLERTRAILTDFGETVKGLPLFVKTLCASAGMRFTDNMYIKYLISILVHKRHVLLECIKLGIPWQGLFHDISKFRPSEFIPYARYFYDTRYGLPDDPRLPDFDIAWLKHHHRNKHHWQHWLLPYDDGCVKILPIPFKHLKEMLADWRGANKAYGTIPLTEWYRNRKHIIMLPDNARNWIEYSLGLTDDYPMEVRIGKASPVTRFKAWFSKRRKS